MDEKILKEARGRAERAVADMVHGDLKVKAFEVILTQLIASKATPTVSAPGRNEVRPRRSPLGGNPKSLPQRILAMQADAFFTDPQPISSVREGLKAHGWHYPLTTLSGALQSLVQKRKLRRERVRDRGKTVWKYSDP